MGPVAGAAVATITAIAWLTGSSGPKKPQKLVALDATKKIPFALAEKIVC